MNTKNNGTETNLQNPAEAIPSTSEPKPESTNINYDELDSLVRRFEKIFYILVPIIAVFVSLFVVGIIIVVQGESPLTVYISLFASAFGSPYEIGVSLTRAMPLILTGLGIAIAARANIINLGGEGQIIMGGLFSTVVALQFQSLPSGLLIPLCLIAGIIGGALWALLPGFFFAKHGTNIIITTILLNDIAVGILGALLKGPLMEEGGYSPQSAALGTQARLPIIYQDARLHIGIIIVLVLVVLSHIFLFKTSKGHEIRILGENPVVAKHSGIKVKAMQIWLMLLAGGFAGLAGSVEIMGSQYRLRENFLSNYGYEALAVAMLGQKSPFGVLLAGILFGALKAGRSGMVRAANLPVSFSMVLSGVIIFFVVVSPVLMKLPKYLATRKIAANTPSPTGQNKKEAA